MSARGLNVFVSIGAKLLPPINRSAGAVEKRFGLMSRRLRVYAAETKASYRAMNAAAAPLVGLAAAGGLMFSARKVIGDSSELAHELQMLRNAGRTTREVSDAMAAANRTISAIPTSTLTDNLKVLNETTGAFGSFQHAVENLTFNQKVGGMLQNMLGDKVGDAGEMFNNLVRGMEMRGAAQDHLRYQREVAEMYRAMIFTGGRFNPEEFLHYSQQANPYTKALSLRYLSKIAPSLIQEFGGDKAGTMQNTWMGTILGKAKNKISTEAWMKLGLLDPKQVVYNKVGPVGWRPGAIEGTDLAMQDPLTWSEKVLIPALRAQGVDTSNQLSVAKTLMPLFRDRNALRLASALVSDLDRQRLHKDEALINKVPSVDKAQKQTLRNDPKLAWSAVTASLTNLSASLFGTGQGDSPVAVALVHVANGINMFAQAIERHPKLGQGLGAALLGSAGLAGLRVLGIGLRFIVGPLGLMARLLSPLVALAPMFLNVLARLAPFVIRGLIMAFAGLSNPVGWAVILAGIAAALIYYFRDDLARAWPKVVAWFKGAWNGLKNWLLSINWSGIGMGIANALTFGLAGKFAAAMARMKASVPSANVGMNSTRGGLAGARARGGPVRRGGTYLVGEEGPELFTAGRGGNVIPFKRTAALMGAAAAMAPMPLAAQPAPGVSVTINVNGAQDPHAIAREVDRQLRVTLRQVGGDNGRFLND